MACSNVGKAAEGEFKSRAKNPFDSSSSDEEETHAAQMKKTSIFPVTQNSNPFDDAEEEEIPHPRGVRNPNPNSYSNPFDDLEEDVPTTTKLPTDESANSNLESITNPFEDEHEHGPSPSSLESKSLFHVEEDNSKYTSAKSPRSSSSRMIKDRAWSISQKAKASILSANLKFRQREASLQLTDTPTNDEVRFPPPSRFENKFVSRTQELLSYDSSPGSHTGKQSKDLLLDIEDPEYAASAPPVEDYVNHAVQDLENHALDKSRETTSAIVNLVKVAEDTRGVAGSTLETLHDQGAQIQRTHEKAVHLDQHLERGEKLLNSLGGIFSKSWKPKKTRKITGPMISRGESFKRRGTPADRAALGLTEGQRYGEEKRYSGGSSLMWESTDFQSQVVRERKIQDDALSDLSNVIGQLKEMSVDMHSEIARQNDGLEHLTDDANELHSRIQQSNMRARRVLRR